jgi:hypothetical protein
MRTTIRHLLWVFPATLGLLGAGCASVPPTGLIAGRRVPAGSAVALVSTPFYPIDAFDTEGSFLQQLRGYGLVPTSSADAPFLVQIHFADEAGGGIGCRILLLKGKVPILSAEGLSQRPSDADLNLPTEPERRAAIRQSAFREAARNFAAKARSPG